MPGYELDWFQVRTHTRKWVCRGNATPLSSHSSGQLARFSVSLRKAARRFLKTICRISAAVEANDTGSGTFKFFRPNPLGNGTIEQFFTVFLEGVHITSDRLFILSTITPATANSPPFEEVTFTYTYMRILYTNGGIEAELRVR